MSLKLNERYPGRFNNPNSDYPQGSFKNRTSPVSKDGSYLEKDWANDKEGFFQSLLYAAGITPDGAVDKVGASQNYDALRKVVSDMIKVSSPVVGAVRKGRMSVAAPSASATFTADEVVVKSALGGSAYVIPSFNKPLNLGTTGPGGMDTGAAPASGSVAIYAIYNPTTGVSALLARNSTAGPAPEIYGGANMPAGYTASALVSSWRTNGSGQLVLGNQFDRIVNFFTIGSLSTSVQQASYVALSLAGSIPSNAKTISGVMAVGSSTASSTSTLAIATAATGTGEIQAGISNAPANLNSYISYSGLVIETALTVYYKLVSTGTISIGNLYISGYTF